VDQKTRRDRRAALLRVLRELRLERGLLQTDVAARLSVPQSYVSKYESGERRLDLAELHEIAETLGVTPVEMVRRYLRNLADL
jgi:transcriptional regulator with XRE-family HTH domain